MKNQNQPDTPAKRILEEKNDKGMTDQEFYSKAGTSSTTLSKLKKDEPLKNSKAYSEIGEALGLNPEWVLKGTGERYKQDPGTWKDESYTTMESVNKYLRTKLDEATSTLNKAQETISVLVNMIPVRDTSGKAQANIYPGDLSLVLASNVART